MGKNNSKILQFPGNSNTEKKTNNKKDIQNKRQKNMSEINIPKKLNSLTYKIIIKKKIKSILDNSSQLKYEVTEDDGRGNKVNIYRWESSEKLKEQPVIVFFLFDDFLQIESSDGKWISKLKKFMKTKFGKKVKFLKEETIDVLEDLTNKVTDHFLNSPVDVSFKLGFKSPLEVRKTKKNKQKLEEYVDSIEIASIFMPENEPAKLIDFNRVRKTLGLKVSKQGKIRDGVEEILVDKMVDRFDDDGVIEAIIVWRDFKDKKGKITGWDKSWAAGVEYLINRWLFNGNICAQKDLADEYNISTNTVSSKYKEIKDKLNIKIRDHRSPNILDDGFFF
ncbi:MAG: hypothetical protein ACQERZ_02700 [Fusobacteriota bacterium]